MKVISNKFFYVQNQAGDVRKTLGCSLWSLFEILKASSGRNFENRMYLALAECQAPLLSLASWKVTVPEQCFWLCSYRIYFATWSSTEKKPDSPVHYEILFFIVEHRYSSAWVQSLESCELYSQSFKIESSFMKKGLSLARHLSESLVIIFFASLLLSRKDY